MVFCAANPAVSLQASCRRQLTDKDARRYPQTIKPKVLAPSGFCCLDSIDCSHKLAFGLHDTKTLSDVVRRFSAHWTRTAAPLVSSRWSCLLHLGSLCLASGAVAGMYFRGLFQGYQVIWDSTFLTQESSVSRFLTVVFGPGFFISDLLGLGLASRTMCRDCLSPGGDQAAGWIHLFAITVAITIIIPRTLLAGWEWRKITYLGKRINIVIDPYYGEVIEAPDSPLQPLTETSKKRRAGSHLTSPISSLSGCTTRRSFRYCALSGRRAVKLLTCKLSSMKRLILFCPS